MIILFIFKILELLQFKSSRSYEYMKIIYERELRAAGWRIIWIIWCDDFLSYNSSPRSSHIWFSYIHNVIIILSRVYNEPIQRPVPTWLVSSIVRALHRYRRAGSRVWIPYKPNFFSGFLFTTAKVASPTVMIFFHIIQIIIFISILTRSIRFLKESPKKYAQKRCHLQTKCIFRYVLSSHLNL